MNRLIALALLPIAACVEFDPGSLITETRVLGASVQVEGEPERSTPRPGEAASVQFVIGGVQREPQVSWSLAICLPTQDPMVPCGSDLLGSSQGSGTTPSLRVVVPASSALGEARALHVSGTICTQAEDCVPLVYELALARAADGSDENLQPDMQQTRFRFDGKDWADSAALAQGCSAQPELVRAAADGKEHRLTIELGPDARELYIGPGMEATYEELQLSTFVDAGELERQFSFVSSDDERERPSVELKWTAPKRLEGADRGVRLLVLVRDSRGGLAQLERALCVVRAASGQLSARQ